MAKTPAQALMGDVARASIRRRFCGVAVRMLAMLIVVKATDPCGQSIWTEPLTRINAVMKVWEFKTSGYTDIRAFDSETGAAVALVQKPDDEPGA
jgi:hypothetical protein